MTVFRGGFLIHYTCAFPKPAYHSWPERSMVPLKTFRNAFGYNDVVLRRKPVRLPGQDLRDVPTYTIPEAAGFLAIPRRTMSYWFQAEKFLRPTARYDHGQISLLSFKDISEAYVLEILRSVYGIGPRKLRDILINVRKETKLKRPLIEADLGVLFGKVIIVKPPRGKAPRRDIDLSSHRNLALPGLIDIAGTRLLRDENNAPYRLYPWRLMSQADNSCPITVDPDIMSGRAVVTGSRIPITLLAGMHRLGQSAEEIATNYKLETEIVRKVLRHIENPLPKVA
jgi:uncharacterized protein (DUF433 family)